MMTRIPKYNVFMGIIGAGKSTTSLNMFYRLATNGYMPANAKTEERYEIGDYCYYPEPVKSNPYLEDFYKDMARWGAIMQFFLLTQRFKMHEDAIQNVWNGKTAIADSAIYSDRAFAKILHDDGLISDRDYATYQDTFQAMSRFLLTPQVVIYLDVKIETAMERITSRGRGCEKGIPAEYLRKLERAYKEFVLPDLVKRGARVEVVDWNNNGIQENMDRLEALL